MKGKSGQLICGDCLKVLKTFPDNCIDTMITDPPASISFMSLKWDRNKGGKWQWIEWLGEIFKECYRVLKPGAIILVWSIPRTSHYTALAIEEGGFQIMDCIYHLYSTGFPKSQDISKMIDKKLGRERKIIGISENTRDRSKHDIHSMNPIPNNPITITEPSSNLAKQFDGYKTVGLKPAAECWWLAMKPNQGTYVENIEKWWLGGLNIGDCLIEYDGFTDPRTFGGSWKTDKAAQKVYNGGYEGRNLTVNQKGRYPSNVIIDGSEEVCNMFPNSKGQLAPGRSDGAPKSQKIYGKMNHAQEVHLPRQENDLSASRFYYKAKPSSTEKSLGCGNLFWYKEKWSDDWKLISKEQYESYQKENDELGKKKNIIANGNTHETVKSIELMEYFCKLTSPPSKGVVLDPFGGSGTTAIAALKTGRKFIVVEQERDYIKIAEHRIKYWIKVGEHSHENFRKNVKQT
ncbi:MAG: DNA-methyltransferase [Candidatus Hodarchaeota archaeon]